MKVSAIVSLALLLISGCSQNSSNLSVQPETNQKGSVLFKIDSQNKPRNVVRVTAELTRSDYEPFYSSLNLLSDTSAEIFINDIAAGDWFLKIDALDSDSTVIYSGETSVTVIAGNTTNINLTLYPTGNGTGSLQINVSWGNNGNQSWVEYPGNPVLKPQNNSWDYDGVWESKILYSDGKYKMWYLGLADNGIGNIGYAESYDGVTWTRPFANPVLSPGNYSSWDSRSISPGAVIKDNGIYKMYYIGWVKQDSNWDIGLATSVDGINWTKYSGNPVIHGSEEWELQVVVSSVLKVNGTYYLYYHGRNNSQYKTELATSVDGINWTKYPDNPVLTATETWENSGIYSASVIYDNNVFKMVYSNVFPNTALGMAVSSDGIHWTKSNNNPIFQNQNTHDGWGSGAIGFPFLIKTGSGYRIYYSGRTYYSQYYRIGFISLTTN